MNAIHWVEKRALAPHEAVPLIITTSHIDKRALLTALARACAFPAYFGGNWDAAWDCLSEYRVTHLWWTSPPDAVIVAEDWAAFLDLLQAAADEWGEPQLWLVPPALTGGRRS